MRNIVLVSAIIAATISCDSFNSDAPATAEDSIITTPITYDSVDVEDITLPPAPESEEFSMMAAAGEEGGCTYATGQDELGQWLVGTCTTSSSAAYSRERAIGEGWSNCTLPEKQGNVWVYDCRANS